LITKYTDIGHSCGNWVIGEWVAFVVGVFLTNNAVGIQAWLTFCDCKSFHIPIRTVATSIEEPHVITVTTETLLGAVTFTTGPIARLTIVLYFDIDHFLCRIKVHSALILAEPGCMIVIIVGRETLPGLNVYNGGGYSNKGTEVGPGDRFVDFDAIEATRGEPVPHVFKPTIPQLRCKFSQSHDKVIRKLLGDHFLPSKVIQSPQLVH
jgi:hypothetical protein